MYGFLLVPPMIAFAYTGQDLAPGVKVSVEQARAAALNAVPGTITDQELEKEDGGSCDEVGAAVYFAKSRIEATAGWRCTSITKNGVVHGINPELGWQ
jgi:hypothetical protein